jgi:aconitate hydratase A / 2-methylisocitrate dehydratase
MSVHVKPSIVVPSSLDSFSCLTALTVGGVEYHYYSLEAAGAQLGLDVQKLPQSHKILLERMLAREDGEIITKEQITALADWVKSGGKSDAEIYVYANRVLLQDLTGGPLIGDLASMRDVVADSGLDPKLINPMVSVDLVVDHSVIVQASGSADSLKKNIDHEFRINRERFSLMKWTGATFNNVTVTPPGFGICHQQMIERLNPVVEQVNDDKGRIILSPSYLIGTDSHTTMAGALGIMAYGVGGIEAEATMLGQPLSLVIPDAVGVRLDNRLREGITATDLALRITELLRKVGVVDKAVIFHGPGAQSLSLADRATISNMAPEYGATVGLFEIDGKTIDYLRTTGRSEKQIAIVEAYARAQGMWADADKPEPVVTISVDLDLTSITPSLSGPKQPKERVELPNISERFWETFAADSNVLPKDAGAERKAAILADFRNEASKVVIPVAKTGGSAGELHNGDFVIAAITSCTNTSNPDVMIAAGLVAKKAVEFGLTVPPHVKTSLAPGSLAVTGYLKSAGLQTYLDTLGFNLVGYGCTTCIGNSGPLLEGISDAVDGAKKDGKFRVAAVLSGNRNFQGRVHETVDANFLASPPLVVAMAIAGNVDRVVRRSDALGVDGKVKSGITEDRLGLGRGRDGRIVFLEDVWPSGAEIESNVRAAVTTEVFSEANRDLSGPDQWKNLPVPAGDQWQWDVNSRYYSVPPYFQNMPMKAVPIRDVIRGRILGIYGNSITTDDISPAAPIGRNTPAGQYLIQSNVPIEDLHNFGARRGDPRVIDRGAWGNVKVQNLMSGVASKGSATIYYSPGAFESNQQMSVYDAAQRYMEDGIRPVVFAGKEYGTGSSRDLAAKSPRNLGVGAVIAESFERIHRANLASMGVLPLQLPEGVTLESLKLKGNETVTIKGMDKLTPRCDVNLHIERDDGTASDIQTRCRIDTNLEMTYFRAGGIPVFVTRKIIEAAGNDNEVDQRQTMGG